MTKQELRSAYLARRKQLSGDDVRNLSVKLSHHLLEFFDFSKFKVVHTFLPIPANNEPDTRIVIADLRANHPEVSICVPKVKPGTGELEHFALKPDTDLVSNAWGIKEPVDGIHVDVTTIDFVLVPLLAFDRRGNRVGYGKGFYDRFLAQCRPDALRLGVSFFEVGDDISDITLDDVPLHYCVTPSGVTIFRPAAPAG